MRRMWICWGVFVLALSTLVAASPNGDERVSEGWKLGVGLGLVNPVAQDSDLYITANLRIRVGDGEKYDRDKDLEWIDAEQEAPVKSDNGGLRTYIEPEVGYWEIDSGGGSIGDLLVGSNLVVEIPNDKFDLFLGVGVGAHFAHGQLGVVGGGASETHLGANLQFGLDRHLSETLSLFGALRIDWIDRSADSTEGKLYVGLRWTL